MDELRSVLDDATTVLRKASSRERQALSASQPSLESRLTLEEPLAALDESVESAITLEVRLSLRADEDDLASHFRAALNSLIDLRNAYVGIETYADFQTQDRKEHMAARRQFESALREFVQRGRQLGGPRAKALQTTTSARPQIPPPSPDS
jgi:hypothetical protein